MYYECNNLADVADYENSCAAVECSGTWFIWGEIAGALYSYVILAGSTDDPSIVSATSIALS